MKRFQVFAGQYYYPQGGWEDWHSEYDTMAEAAAVSQALIGKEPWGGKCNWAHVADFEKPPTYGLAYVAKYPEKAKP